ncbi:MAG TPA: hypothetical protein VG796_09885 [Verrucomicrobiales bacterium]|nr:hypothetical protein [Verrucomicrobiales bacterium]
MIDYEAVPDGFVVVSILNNLPRVTELPTIDEFQRAMSPLQLLFKC